MEKNLFILIAIPEVLSQTEALSKNATRVGKGSFRSRQNDFGLRRWSGRGAQGIRDFSSGKREDRHGFCRGFYHFVNLHILLQV